MISLFPKRALNDWIICSTSSVSQNYHWILFTRNSEFPRILLCSNVGYEFIISIVLVFFNFDKYRQNTIMTRSFRPKKIWVMEVNQAPFHEEEAKLWRNTAIALFFLVLYYQRSSKKSENLFFRFISLWVFFWMNFRVLWGFEPLHESFWLL